MDFEKSIARHFRMKFGSIGEKLWMNELPIIEGDNAIDAQEFVDHAQRSLKQLDIVNPRSIPCSSQGTQGSGKSIGI